MIAEDLKSWAGGQLNKSLRIFVLGRFEVEQGPRLIESEQWRSTKARSLFKILVSRRGYQISRQEAAELLWPELDQDRGVNNLHQAVYSLRRTLEPGLERATGSIYLKSEGSKLQLNPALISWIDLEEFRRLQRQAQVSHDLNLYEEAVALYYGDYLPEDMYEDWSVYRREALRQEWITLLMHMAALYQANSQEDKYQQCLHRILESDFSHEDSVQKLMQTLAENGRNEESLSLYRSFATRLKNRLNLEPLAETHQLYQQIASGKGREHEILEKPQGVSRAPHPNNFEHQTSQVVGSASAGFIKLNKPFAENLLPKIEETSKKGAYATTSNLQPPTPLLIGRKAEQILWQQQLKDGLGGKGSLTLLTGEAGIGKTRLARTLARQAEQAGFEVLYLTCQPEQSALPFSTIFELLEQAFSKLSNEELDNCLKYCYPELGRLLPGLSARLQVLGQPPAFSAHDTNPKTPETGLLENLFSSVTQALSWVERQHPVVLVLDGLQCLGDAMVRLLRYLLIHPKLPSLVVLSTLRPVASDPAQAESGHLLNWASENSQTVLKLERLKANELKQLLGQQLAQPPGTNLLELVSRVSGGNPRLALELVTNWGKEGQLCLINGCWELSERWNGQLPPSLAAYIKRVVGTLSNEAQVLLLLASLIATETGLQSPPTGQPSGPKFKVQSSKFNSHSEAEVQSFKPELQKQNFEPQTLNFELTFSFDILRQIVLHRSDGAGWWIELDKTRLGQALTEVTGCGLVEEQGVEYSFSYPLLVEALTANLPYSQRQCWREVIGWAQDKLSSGATGLGGYTHD